MRNKWLLILGLAACGGGGDDAADAAVDGNDMTAFKPLIMSSWSLQPGTGESRCSETSCCQTLV